MVQGAVRGRRREDLAGGLLLRPRDPRGRRLRGEGRAQRPAIFRQPARHRRALHPLLCRRADRPRARAAARHVVHRRQRATALRGRGPRRLARHGGGGHRADPSPQGAPRSASRGRDARAQRGSGRRAASRARRAEGSAQDHARKHRPGHSDGRRARRRAGLQRARLYPPRPPLRDARRTAEHRRGRRAAGRRRRLSRCDRRIRRDGQARGARRALRHLRARPQQRHCRRGARRAAARRRQRADLYRRHRGAACPRRAARQRRTPRACPRREPAEGARASATAIKDA